MVRSNESTGLAARAPSALVTPEGPGGPITTNAVFVSVLAVLFATGWAANHFAALMPAITDGMGVRSEGARRCSQRRSGADWRFRRRPIRGRGDRRGRLRGCSTVLRGRCSHSRGRDGYSRRGG
jgi:hypothetical protein